MTQRSYYGSRPSLGESLALIIYNGLSPDDFSAESQRQVAALRPSIGSRYDHFQHTYRDDPAAFIHDCVDWEGGSPADYQPDIAPPPGIAHPHPPAGDWRGVRAGLRRSRKHGRCARRPFDVRIR